MGTNYEGPLLSTIQWNLAITKCHGTEKIVPYNAWVHRRTDNFLTEGAVDHLSKKLSQVAQIFTKQSSTKRNEGYTMQQHRAYWHMKMARYSFSGSIPSKFERKLCRHKQTFRKITTSCIR